MKIVFVSPYGHRGAHSGARRRVEALSQAFVEKGHEVSCLSPWEPRSGKVRHISFCLEGGMLRRLLVNLWLTVKLHLIRPDVVVSECPLAPVGFGRFVTVHTIHDAKFITPYTRQNRRVHKLLHWFSSRLSSVVLTVSQAEKERICRALNLSANRVMVSYNGLSESWFHKRPKVVDFGKAYDVLYVSNFAPHKGHKELLRALEGAELKTVLVGADFGTLDECKRVAQERSLDVTFRSGLSESELIELYDAAKVFVFPSRLEGFGIPYIEARARGLPVIAEDLPVFRELQEHVGGKLITFDNIRCARAHIERALELSSEDSDLSAFRWEAIADQLLRDINPDGKV